MKDKSSQLQSRLSIERTKLANRRTLLAHIRSAIALFVAGSGLVNLIPDSLWVYTGIFCLAMSPVPIIAGIIEYFKIQKIIEFESSQLELFSEIEEDL